MITTASLASLPARALVRAYRAAVNRLEVEGTGGRDLLVLEGAIRARGLL